GRAILRVEPDGTVTLYHSWTEMGQGVHTVLRQMACEELGLPVERVRVVVDTARKLKAAGRIEDLAGREFVGEFTVDWTTSNDAAEPVTHLAYGWATQVVLLDDDGRLRKVIAAHDVGRAINPTLLEGQIEGGVHMGLGQALSEEFVVEDGVPRTTTLKSLHIIPPTGMPEVEVVLVEEPQPEGPYGAKGIGEAPLVPTASAVRAALEAFDGIHRTRL